MTSCSTVPDILRTELVGKNGESCQFHVRYFEVGPGGYSTLEKHVHEHVVIPIRGRGVVTTTSVAVIASCCTHVFVVHW